MGTNSGSAYGARNFTEAHAHIDTMKMRSGSGR